MIRTCDACIDAIAWESGWRSPKDFYKALREFTGITPGAIRRLPEHQFCHVVDNDLALPSPKFQSISVDGGRRNGRLVAPAGRRDVPINAPPPRSQRAR